MLFLVVIPGCATFQDRSGDAAEGEGYAASETTFSAYSQEIPGTDVEIAMVPVEGGTFLMGRSSDEDGKESHEGPQREVAVNSFWMSSHEITWEQYNLFAQEVIDKEIGNEVLERFGIEADAITTPSPPYGDGAFGMGEDGRPVISITHYAAVVYAMWLTAKTGEFHRLPTEAEWEYACRGGTSSTYYFGDDPDQLDDYEWHWGNSSGSYGRVAEKNPNPFGLYDMMGNVAEWTMDEFHLDYHEKLEGEVADNPLFLPDVLYPRAARGGSWRDDAEDIRCTHRRGSSPRWSRDDPQIPRSMWWHTNAPMVGFRIIRPKETPSREKMEKYWIMPVLDM
ncbi:SUMF1/EgtB/PvdO family nonheme iron enzyme [Balneolales bacterium ANBcel1]|nr:SUMF1/EgtB/PvdO family nonheme iron enzyme [Balneolales bacterium ANBcel1]